MTRAKKISKKRRKLVEWGERHAEELMFLEGSEFDVAILGIVTGKDIRAKVLYGTKRVLQVLQKMGIKQGLHEDQAMEQALEWFSVNTSDAYMGEHTPCFLEDAWE